MDQGPVRPRREGRPLEAGPVEPLQGELLESPGMPLGGDPAHVAAMIVAAAIVSPFAALAAGLSWRVFKWAAGW
jgi:hypothetical protein